MLTPRRIRPSPTAPRVGLFCVCGSNLGQRPLLQPVGQVGAIDLVGVAYAVCLNVPVLIQSMRV
jgi:hypothetical protein